MQFTRTRQTPDRLARIYHSLQWYESHGITQRKPFIRMARVMPTLMNRIRLMCVLDNPKPGSEIEEHSKRDRESTLLLNLLGSLSISRVLSCRKVNFH